MVEGKIFPRLKIKYKIKGQKIEKVTFHFCQFSPIFLSHFFGNTPSAPPEYAPCYAKQWPEVQNAALLGSVRVHSTVGMYFPRGGRSAQLLFPHES